MTIKLLAEHNLEFLSLKGGYTGSSESTPVKMPHCWKSHVMALIWISKPAFLIWYERLSDSIYDLILYMHSKLIHSDTTQANFPFSDTAHHSQTSCLYIVHVLTGMSIRLSDLYLTGSCYY